MSRREIYALLGQDEEIIIPEDKNRRKVKPQRVSRYWPGKAPEFTEESSESHIIEQETEDPRLKRIEQSTESTGRRRNHQAEVITVTPEPTTKPIENIITFSSGNSSRTLLFGLSTGSSDKGEGEGVGGYPEEVEATLKTESEDSESESDEEEVAPVPIIKPVFIPREGRVTIKEREKQQMSDFEFFEKERLKKLEIQEEAKKQILNPDVKEEDEESQLPDDSDGDDEEEYELWKVRELNRIKRDYLEKIQLELQAEEIQARREMDDEEREKDNERIDANKVKVNKGKMSFLQKYYHKGAFFMDKLDSGAEPIYARDFNAPVGDDLIDKEKLPKAMQVRRGKFGKIGQTKHTHLKDVDTTDFSAWGGKDSKKRKKEDVFDRPGKS